MWPEPASGVRRDLGRAARLGLTPQAIHAGPFGAKKRPMRGLTHALTQEATAEAAVERVCASTTEPAAVEALVELLARPHKAALALPAAEALAALPDHPCSTRW